VRETSATLGDYSALSVEAAGARAFINVYDHTLQLYTYNLPFLDVGGWRKRRLSGKGTGTV